MLRRLPNLGRGRQGGHTFEIGVVAQHCTELPIGEQARARFVLKRRSRLTVTEAEPVAEDGSVEWNTVCMQTATLHKEGGGWRRKEFVLKVQALKESAYGLGLDQYVTIAKVALDLAPFCQAEAVGPRQLTIQLQPQGRLSLLVQTCWLQHFDAAHRDRDTLTDLSYLSLERSQATSTALGGGFSTANEEQDLSGFEGSIRAVYYPPGAATAAAAAPNVGGHQQADAASTAGSTAAAAAAGAGAGPSPPKRALALAAAALGRGKPPRVPGAHKERDPAAARPQSSEQQSVASSSVTGQEAASSVCHSVAGDGTGDHAAACQSQGFGPGAPVLLQRSATAPSLGTASARRPRGATRLQLDSVAAGDALGTPTLAGRPWGAARRKERPVAAAQGGVARGMPEEEWSPIDVREAVEQLYDSEEEATPKPTVVGTVKRWFTKGRNGGGGSATPSPLPCATTAKQLHAEFRTPQPVAPRATPDPEELLTIDKESSLSALKRRCKRLVAEREEARAAEFAEASFAIDLQNEVDKLRREKRDMLSRLQTTEAQLLSTYRDEAATDLIQALAATRVELAQREYALLQAQGALRAKDAQMERLRERLTRLETKYRSSVNALSPGASCPASAASPWSVATSPDQAGRRQQQQRREQEQEPSEAEEAGMAGGEEEEAGSTRGGTRAGTQALQRTPDSLRLRLHDNPLALPAPAGSPQLLEAGGSYASYGSSLHSPMGARSMLRADC